MHAVRLERFVAVFTALVLAVSACTPAPSSPPPAPAQPAAPAAPAKPAAAASPTESSAVAAPSKPASKPATQPEATVTVAFHSFSKDILDPSLDGATGLILYGEMYDW